MVEGCAGRVKGDGSVCETHPHTHTDIHTYNNFLLFGFFYSAFHHGNKYFI